VRVLLAVLTSLALACAGVTDAKEATPGAPQTVTIRDGSLSLKASLWKPAGRGPFPAVLFNHGSYGSTDVLSPEEARTVGELFARHGYVLLFLYRSGVGLSKDQGPSEGELMDRAFAEHGAEGRNRTQVLLLESEELDQALAALAYLRKMPDVDPKRIAVAGHSFGGSLTLLLAEREPTLRAAVNFGGSARSWERSPELQARLIKAVERVRVPVFFIHAANDYSTKPGEVLGAEMERFGHPQRVKIYPAVGSTAAEGHDLVYRAPATWEGDVFAFLDEYLRH